jgi:hypothetical protein
VNPSGKSPERPQGEEWASFEAGPALAKRGEGRP